MSLVFKPKFKIEKPEVILDKNRCLVNIKKLVNKAASSGTTLRPHFKTHQSHEIGRWFRNLGVEKITVSSADMAQYFAEDGWDDITIAFPHNIHETKKIDTLAQKLQVGVLVDNLVAVKSLEKLKNSVNVWIKIDCGYGRAGVIWDKPQEIVNLIVEIKNLKKHKFKGILSHFGNTYGAKDSADVLKTFEVSSKRIIDLKNHIESSGITGFQVSIGDTPSCSLVEDLSEFDEIRPGNFVFYDVMQMAKGVCLDTEIAVALACPVVGKYSDRGEVVIYGGGVHLSKERISDSSGKDIYGYLLENQDGRFESILLKAPLISLSQEHGIIKPTIDIFNKLEIGDFVLVAPIHSCLTVNLNSILITPKGEVLHKL